MSKTQPEPKSEPKSEPKPETKPGTETKPKDDINSLKTLAMPELMKKLGTSSEGLTQSEAAKLALGLTHLPSRLTFAGVANRAFSAAIGRRPARPGWNARSVASASNSGMKTSYGNVAKCLAMGVAGGLVLGCLARRKAVSAGQVAIVTGGSRGLGLGLAHRFGRAGVKLVLVARDSGELERAAGELVETGSVSDRSCVLTYACDLRDTAEAGKLVEAALARFGRLDLLINNAGIIVVGPAENQTVEVYREAMEVDFFAALQCIYAALPVFLRQRSGAIVNIASIGGKMAVPHLLPYVAAKFALTGLSEGLHAELRGKGVRVTTVCPGLMRTGGEVHAQFSGQIEKEKAWFQFAARMPVLAASADHAAEKIFDAVDAGRAEITITPQAWLAARFAGLAPETTQFAAGMVNACVLPAPTQSACLPRRRKSGGLSPLRNLGARARHPRAGGRRKNGGMKSYVDFETGYS